MNRDQKRLARMMNHFAGTHEDRKAEKATRKLLRSDRQPKTPRKRLRVAQLGELDEEDLEQLGARQAIPRTPRTGSTTSAGFEPARSKPAGRPAAAPTPRAGQPALIVGLSPGHAQLLFDTGSRATAELARELAETSQSSIAVGDRVRVAELEADTWRVVAVEPRRSRLVRCDPGHARRERVVAANVDVGVVVCAARQPPLRPGLIDRYWAALTRGDIVTVVVVNKLDQLRNSAQRSELDAKLAPYHELGLEVLECCAHDGRGIEELRTRLSARVGVLVGHSGVGKSSLLAALAPESAPRVGAIRPERETPGSSGALGAGRFASYQRLRAELVV